LGKAYTYLREMANSRYEYVKTFEHDPPLLPNCWVVARVDGRGFHKFCDLHGFVKPNDDRAIGLMNAAAMSVMLEFRDIVIAYGVSDEYSFVLKKDATLFSRRTSKINTSIVSQFTAAYVMNWSKFFPSTSLKSIPTFDGRLVCYPTDENIKDYLNWRQVDCHINNLYNTCFWALVQKGNLSHTEAEQKLKKTVSGDKNEMLWKDFQINYNESPAVHRKGSILIWDQVQGLGLTEADVCDEPDTKTNPTEAVCEEESVMAADLTGVQPEKRRRPRSELTLIHEDLISETFWNVHQGIIPSVSKSQAKKKARKEAARSFREAGCVVHTPD